VLSNAILHVAKPTVIGTLVESRKDLKDKNRQAAKVAKNFCLFSS